MATDGLRKQRDIEQRIESEWREATKHFERMMREEPEDRERCIRRATQHLRTPAVAEMLLQASHKMGFRNALQSYELARLVLVVAERISGYDPRVGCPLVYTDYQALGLAQMANAARIGCWWGLAEEKMTKAFERYPAGTGIPRVVARLHSLRASLRKDRRQYDEALEDLVIAQELYDEMGNKVDVAKVLLNRGTVLFFQHRFQQAIDANLRALTTIDEWREPALASMSSFNSAACYLELGDLDSALKCCSLLPPLEELGVPRGSMYHGYRIWQLARIQLAKHSFDEARVLLLQALDIFRNRQIPFNEALVLLDLARLLFEEVSPPTDEFFTMAKQAAQLLKQQTFRPEATEVTRLLVETTESRQLSGPQIQLLSQRLKEYAGSP
ncbi:MAG: tetratricopeptide repeat protein [Acidobacteriota bacterium]